ncbi:hypothetical protein MiTe_03197 [Microcystis aeruginosa NIES-2520]|jgi:hypothetical protein|uniref:Uncharacterized protein n=1 Tax=Microcystis aeruginosa NIES-2520 TaxID=2303982 RepID=A0A5A5RT94_MICAE|nr:MULTISPECIES: hypothetical protein [Microcystis]MDJ0524292.1 hypothetical protein [Microcystis sp. M53600_WE12]MCA2669084.1 hypothetical protein [Microcystis sp. M045S2]MCA2714398.1 hypothetical protein [Microcystis sp. M172S2]MCA2803586.1 hypothetical protein [Microcystis sp. M114S2]MCA2813308.1 hypothetical protein [Microcystis sp. M090S1]
MKASSLVFSLVLGIAASTLINLKTIKSQALAGQLPPSQGIVTLGLAREVADWIDSLDSPLLKAVGKVEREYQKY